MNAFRAIEKTLQSLLDMPVQMSLESDQKTQLTSDQMHLNALEINFRPHVNN